MQASALFTRQRANLAAHHEGKGDARAASGTTGTRAVVLEGGFDPVLEAALLVRLVHLRQPPTGVRQPRLECLLLLTEAPLALAEAGGLEPAHGHLLGVALPLGAVVLALRRGRGQDHGLGQDLGRRGGRGRLVLAPQDLLEVGAIRIRLAGEHVFLALRQRVAVQSGCCDWGLQGLASLLPLGKRKST